MSDKSQNTDLEGFPGHPTAAEIGLTDAEMEAARMELKEKIRQARAIILQRVASQAFDMINYMPCPVCERFDDGGYHCSRPIGCGATAREAARINDVAFGVKELPHVD